LIETDASLGRIAENNDKTVLHSATRMDHVEVVTTILNKDPGTGNYYLQKLPLHTTLRFH
jgi:hypothetical protein